MTPNQLIGAVLRAPVDLLWNGGIGTYVKASSEGHSDVGDRSNDALRVNADELRCKVIGEGGNLGFSQLGRIEYSLRGGGMNTDWDSSAASATSLFCAPPGATDPATGPAGRSGWAAGSSWSGSRTELWSSTTWRLILWKRTTWPRKMRTLSGLRHSRNSLFG